MSDIIIPSGWRERLEELQSSRHGAWIVAGFAVAVVAVALLMWSRGAPAQIAPPATAQAVDQSAYGAIAPSPSVGPLFVDVAGAVRRPGLYRLETGARVADAIQAAGGALRGADLQALNLAQPLSDGLKVEVARRGQQVAASVSSGVSPSPSVAVVDINTADEAALETIPGVGPVTANAILDYRSRIGHFSAIEQLLDVNGIGPATIENIRPYISI
ncbi:MAG: helix-hairpin-helix domain-containing protein [Actinomycetota bacterium]|nr:helix-hairpin-helix domain-containing protein [Actinomycetota bacterium]